MWNVQPTPEEEIMYNVINGAQSDDIDEDLNDDPQDPSRIVSISEARKAVKTLQSFIELCSNTGDDIFYPLFNIENKIYVESVNFLK